MIFHECGAMSQGYIGYHLQQAIKQELNKRNINKDIISVVTQVVLDEKDIAFKNPTKPVGIFYDKEDAYSLALEKGYVFVENSGRGYRRVVASSIPCEIVELDVIKQLFTKMKDMNV